MGQWKRKYVCNTAYTGIPEATKKTSCRNIYIRVQKLSYSINIQWIRMQNNVHGKTRGHEEAGTLNRAGTTAQTRRSNRRINKDKYQS